MNACFKYFKYSNKEKIKRGSHDRSRRQEHIVFVTGRGLQNGPGVYARFAKSRGDFPSNCMTVTQCSTSKNEPGIIAFPHRPSSKKNQAKAKPILTFLSRNSVLSSRRIGSCRRVELAHVYENREKLDIAGRGRARG